MENRQEQINKKGRDLLILFQEKSTLQMKIITRLVDQVANLEQRYSELEREITKLQNKKRGF